MNTHETYYLNIVPSKLRVDMSYQRTAKPALINRIVNHFDMDIFNPPKVSHRADGFYYIFDGQHSMLAHKRVFGDNAPINCKVYERLTYDEEVELFVQQTGEHSDVATNDKLRADYCKSGSDVRAMAEAAEKVGVRIDFIKGNCPNHTSASQTAYSIWKLLGRDNFINVLDVIKQTWGGEAESFTNGFLKGMAYIYKFYGALIKNKDVVSALSRNTPLYYSSRARDVKGTVMVRYATVFIEAYNYKKKNRIEVPKNN